MTGPIALPSVTTVIGILDKPALITWAANMAAETALDNIGMLTKRLANEARPDLVKWIADGRYRAKKGGTRSATALGTVVHDCCENYAFGHPVGINKDDEAWPFFEQFEQWAKREEPEFEVAECTVAGGMSTPLVGPREFTDQFGYGGTLDGIWNWRGKRVIIDYKTTREPFDKEGKPTGPYPEVVLQLAAYRYADLLIPTRVRTSTQFSRRVYELSEEDIVGAVPMPVADAAYVIHLTPSSCRAYPINADRGAYRMFESLRGFYNDWRDVRSRIGKAE